MAQSFGTQFDPSQYLDQVNMKRQKLNQPLAPFTPLSELPDQQLLRMMAQGRSGSTNYVSGGNPYFNNLVDRNPVKTPSHPDVQAKRTDVLNPYNQDAYWISRWRDNSLNNRIREWKANQPKDQGRPEKQADPLAALRQTVQNLPDIMSMAVGQRARRQIAPIYRPQIRTNRRLIRSTVKQGKRAANDVQGYYEQAGAKVAGFGNASRQSQGKALNKLGNGNAEARIAAQGIKGSGKASRSFFNQMQGALAGEGAVAAANTRRSYNDVANQYRQDLAEVMSERNAAIQAQKLELRKGINKSASKIYDEYYLGGIQSGLSKAEARKQALALAGTKSKAVRGMVAKSILKNRGKENTLIKTIDSGSDASLEDIQDMRDSSLEAYKAISDDMAAADPVAAAAKMKAWRQYNRYQQIAQQALGLNAKGK